ncbi:unnamed protein product [Closterium sp. NIES-53]
MSGVSPALAATADNSVCSQWTTGDAVARLAVSRYSSPATASLSRLMLPYLFPDLAAFATVANLITHLRTSDARYRSALPTEFSAKNPPSMYITLYYLVTRLPDSLASVRDHFLSLCPTELTVNLLEERLTAAEKSIVAVGASRGDPRAPFFEGCSPVPLLPSVAFAAAVDLVGAKVGAASAPSGRRRNSKGKGGKGGGGDGGGGGGGSGGGGGGGGRGGGGGGSGGFSGGGGGGGGSGSGGGGSGSGGGGGGGGGAGRGGAAQHGGFGGSQRQQQPRSRETPSAQRLREWYAGRGRSRGVGPCTYVLHPGGHRGETCGLPHNAQRCFGWLTDAWRAQFDDAVELPCWGDLLKENVAIFDLDFDAILAAMYAMNDSAEGDCYQCVPLDPGIESAALGASAFAAPCTSESAAPGTSESAAPGAGGTKPTEGIRQTFTLPASPQQNGIAERCIGMVMDVARTSMIHAAAPHFLWPFAVQYAAHQINLQPRVSLPETTPTLRWTGKVGDASVFRVSGSRAFVRDTSADKLSSRAIPCVFLGFPPDAFGWQFYNPTSRRVLSSQDVTFDESVDPVEPVKVAVESGAARGAEPAGAGPGGAVPGVAESEGAEPGGAESEGAEPAGVEPERVEPWGVESGGAEPGGAEPERAESGGPPGVPSRREPLSPQWLPGAAGGAAGAGAAGAAGSGGAGAGGTGAVGGPTGVGVAGGNGAAGPGGARTGGIGATGARGAAGVGAVAAGAVATGGAAGAGAVGAGAVATGGAAGAGAAGGTGAGGAAGVVAGDPGAEGTGAVSAVSGGAARPRPYYIPLLQQVLGLPTSTGPPPPLLSPPPVQSQLQLQPASPLPGPSPYSGPTRGLTERREPESCPASPESRPASNESRPESLVRAVRTGRRVPRQRPPPVPSTHSMTLRPSTAPQRVPLPSPPASSLPDGPDPESDSLRAATPTVPRFLATVVANPLFESTAASTLSTSVCPPSVGGECALGADVLEDRQEEFECFAAALHHLVSMLLAPKGDPDAPDIPTPCSCAEAIEGPYSSQWQTAMDTEMASWKVKRPPGSPPVFKVRYVARGFSQRQGVDFFQTFSPTLKMTTLRVLLHVAAQRDYELHSLDISTAFLQGSLHEEIWLRRPSSFTGSFPAGTQWSLRRPVYGLRQAPREWHDTLRTTLAALGFAPSTADPSLFLRTDTTLPPFYVLMYVDDLVFATADIEALAHVKSELQKRHTCTDLGELTSYLGLRITRDRAQGTITLTQSHMVQQVLQRFDFTYSSPQSTPLPAGHSLSSPPSDESIEPSGPYPKLVGCLMYLMTCTRPDLAYLLSLLACYVAPGRHTKEHMDAAKRVLRYLCSTSGMRLGLGGRAHLPADQLGRGASFSSSSGPSPSGSASGGAASGDTEPGGTESEGAETRGAKLGVVQTGGGEPGGAEPEGVEPGGVEPQGAASSGGSAGASPRLSLQQLCEWLVRRACLRSGATGARGAGAARGGGDRVAAGAGVTGCTATTGPGGARTRATGAGGSGVGCAGAGGAGVGGTGAGGAGVGGPGVGGAGAGGAGAVDPGGAVRPRPYFIPLLQQVLGTPSSTGLAPPLLCPPPDQSQSPLQPASPLPAPSPYTEQSSGLTERLEPASCPVSPVRTARRVPRSGPPPFCWCNPTVCIRLVVRVRTCVCAWNGSRA